MLDAMAKYDSMRKLERNKALYDYFLANQHLSYKEIGDIYNIDPSRVCRIIQKERERRDREEERAREVQVA
jgi:DNA-directed RNA polymerase specialized sigma subunit